jgi:hypothetical protein
VAIADLARGYFAEAETPCQQSLDILEKTSPPDYSALIDSLSAYAFLLEKTKRKAKAELLETRVMVYRAKLNEHKTKDELKLAVQ